MMELINADYSTGIIVEELKNEVLKIKLDQYLGLHDVPNRRKQIALKEFEKEARLIVFFKKG